MSASAADLVPMILCDSREKWTQPGSRDTHISGYFDRHGIAYRVQKLDVGDYMLQGGRITVDRKASLEEISGNLLNPADKRRFWAEVRRAYEQRIRLVVLVETNKIKQLEDLQQWHSAYTPVSGSALIREMKRLQNAYGVRFVFCPKVSAARKIIEILKGDQK